MSTCGSWMSKGFPEQGWCPPGGLVTQLHSIRLKSPILDPNGVPSIAITKVVVAITAARTQ